MFILFTKRQIINLPLIDVREDIVFDKRKIEIFSAGCPLCVEAEEKVRKLACPSCDVAVRDMHEPKAVERARRLGIQSVPAVVIDGKLASCCGRQAVDEETLKAEGLGKPLSSNW
jgi:glutaredoxin